MIPNGNLELYKGKQSGGNGKHMSIYKRISSHFDILLKDNSLFKNNTMFNGAYNRGRNKMSDHNSTKDELRKQKHIVIHKIVFI